jgi:hypothetical protein
MSRPSAAVLTSRCLSFSASAGAQSGRRIPDRKCLWPFLSLLGGNDPLRPGILMALPTGRRSPPPKKAPVSSAYRADRCNSVSRPSCSGIALDHRQPRYFWPFFDDEPNLRVAENALPYQSLHQAADRIAFWPALIRAIGKGTRSKKERGRGGRNSRQRAQLGAIRLRREAQLQTGDPIRRQRSADFEPTRESFRSSDHHA